MAFMKKKRKKKKQKKIEMVANKLTKEQREFLDYKDVGTLRRFMSEQGRILGRKRSGCDAQGQRSLARAIKHARHMALLPFVE
ncbi:MAG: 30S ribosomal protein S18 [Planctomycetes bacterium]|nr:30S ribosomal protein S18 [Planctomycetota bacterium]NUQ34220.1 30S ribosomal protein S18 [Planctomycetaceae bacterium]